MEHGVRAVDPGLDLVRDEVAFDQAETRLSHHPLEVLCSHGIVAGRAPVDAENGGPALQQGLYEV